MRQVGAGDPARGRHRHDRAARRRERHRQGAVRARRARAERASNGPFVAINCAAIPETLLEAELFGYEQGAFTGATQRKLGKFELANRGTLVPRRDRRAAAGAAGQDSARARGAHLRAARRHRLASRSTCASSRPPTAISKQAVAARQFREDLYFRLSVFPITVPPLRERRRGHSDSRAALHRARCRELGKTAADAVAGGARSAQAYPWPGNVRELQNCLERAVILADGDTIHPQASQPQGGDHVAAAENPLAKLDLSGTLADVTSRAVEAVERQAIRRALR